MNPKQVLLAVAQGSEEIETVVPLDLLRRAGANVVVAGPWNGPVTLSHGLSILPDVCIDVVTREYDLIVLPGGLPGATNLRDCRRLQELLKAQAAAGRLIAAICASPAMVLGAQGFLEGLSATCYPGCEEGVTGVDWRTSEPVVRCKNFITGRGPGAAYPFGLALVEALYGAPFRQRLEKDTMYL